jgi:hypothetical protein
MFFDRVESENKTSMEVIMNRISLTMNADFFNGIVLRLNHATHDFDTPEAYVKDMTESLNLQKPEARKDLISLLTLLYRVNSPRPLIIDEESVTSLSFHYNTTDEVLETTITLTLTFEFNEHDDIEEVITLNNEFQF